VLCSVLNDAAWHNVVWHGIIARGTRFVGDGSLARDRLKAAGR